LTLVHVDCDVQENFGFKWTGFHDELLTVDDGLFDLELMRDVMDDEGG
jgi:hypothetical protein